VTSISYNAFLDCSGLTEVRSKIIEPFAIDYVFQNYNIPLYVPIGTKEKYAATDGWKRFTNIIEVDFDNPVVEVPGDLNGDTSVDVGDIMSVINFMAGLGGDMPLEQADVNGDGSVDVGDVMFIINLMTSGSQTVETPEAYTACPNDNHPHLIDLGLPSGTKWACCNIGASTPEDYGGYYAWGEVQTKSTYNWDTYLYGNSNDDVVNIGSDIAGTQYDAATSNWGAPWHIPTDDQRVELMSNCTTVWTSKNGVAGREFTGPNGGTIFLPAAGYRWGDGVTDAGSFGYYWSPTLYEGSPSNVRILSITSGDVYTNTGRRFDGYSVRAVRQ